MASNDVDASEDVNDFLLRIRELGEKRDKEDEERTKKLEQEILQGRKEREARRAERARSISPTKDSPLLDSPRLSTSSLNQRVIDPPEHLEPTVPTSDVDTSCRSDNDEKPTAVDGEQGEPKPSDIAVDYSPKHSRTRSGTLSWQQRPSSRDFSYTPSFTATSPTRENRLRTVSNVSEDDRGLNPYPIAPPSPSKDALSFRRSTDRVPESPEPRKYSEDLPLDAAPSPSSSQISPRMIREYGIEPEKPAGDMDRTEDRSWSPSRPTSTIGDSSMSRRYSTVSSASTAPGLGSPIPLSSAQKFDARKAGPGLEEPTSTPSSPRRLSPERSTSPTKGLGGFVQSAMMKRSDSVSKRWSAQLPPGLAGISRANSVASNRNSYAGSPRNDMPPTPSSSRLGRDGPPSPQRPGSSHSEATVLQQTKENERPATPPTYRSSMRADGSPTRTPLSVHTRSASALGWDEQNTGSGSQASSPMMSRTMDAKRWSPTKASWLESALNRPETPRHVKQPSQPSAWSRERQSRTSVDLGRRGSFKEVTPVGLMRTAGPGAHFKKPSISAIPDLPKSPEPSKAREMEPEPVKETILERVSDPVPDPVKAAPEPESPASEPVKDPVPGPVAEGLGIKEEGSESTSMPRDNATLSTDDTADPPPTEKSSQQGPESETGTKGTTTDKPALAIKPLGSLSSVPREPISPKPKPQSPVMDFRANLRRREVTKESPTNQAKEEPLAEFKNVFGRLRKTETSNYVAPDELKDNILRGKAALNATGGPQKSQRVDEFKDSLLKQKEAMKVGGGSLRRNTASENNAPEEAPAVPEAIAKRHNMTLASQAKATRSPDAPSSPSPVTPATPRFASISPLGDKEPKDSESPTSTPVAVPAPEQSEEKTEETVPNASDAELAPLEDKTADPVPIDTERMDGNKGIDVERQPDEAKIEASPRQSTEETAKSARSSPPDDIAGVTETPPATEGPPAKGKLAGRINPALAGLLSRGPPAPSDGPRRTLPTEAMGENRPSSGDTSAPLTHMTKSRARGPKRRLPKATGIEPTSSAPVVSTPDHETTFVPKEPETGPVSVDESTVDPSTRVPETTAVDFPPLVPAESVCPDTTSFDSKHPDARPMSVDESVGDPSTQPPDEISSPTGDTTSEQATSSFTSKPADPRDSLQTLNSGSRVSESVDRSPTTDLDSDDQQDKGIDREVESQKETPPAEPAISPRSISPMPVSPPSHASVHTVRLSDRYSSPSPSPLQTSFEEDGTGSSIGTQRSSAAIPGDNAPRDISPPEKSLPTPPVPPKDSLDKPADRRLPQPGPTLSLVSDPTEAKGIICSFFKMSPHCSARVNIDPQLILTSGNGDLKIRTLKKQIWEITADVKRQDLPANQEYILYEGSMYLCVHVFEVDNSTRTEVQLWCGDDVPESSIDDAQAFARKVARENGCKLELLKQGKETAHFIAALGGILITRRGSNSRSTSSALYMLCGRRHLGQMVFDEVDLARRNLCSGYPFVISAPFGNLYLWKGKGSGAEEIGAARLIGMDLGLTGEIEEVAEGQEPESFFENFPDYRGSGEYIRSEYWQLKPNHAHFRTRLLRIDHELGQRSGFWIRRPGTSSPVIRPNDTAQEIVPFCYKDLTSKDIYILDMFFEIYVIVGSHASQRSAEFASAVIFAHEYGILAASLQDRPFIPKTFVSIGGLPESCRSVFRKWSKRTWQVPLRVLSLNAAIDAIRS